MQGEDKQATLERFGDARVGIRRLEKLQETVSRLFVRRRVAVARTQLDGMPRVRLFVTDAHISSVPLGGARHGGGLCQLFLDCATDFPPYT